MGNDQKNGNQFMNFEITPDAGKPKATKRHIASVITDSAGKPKPQSKPDEQVSDPKDSKKNKDE